MIGPVFSYLNQQDAATRSFTARVLVLALAAILVLMAGATIVLAMQGKPVPDEIRNVLLFISGGAVFGTGSHLGSSGTVGTPPVVVDHPS